MSKQFKIMAQLTNPQIVRRRRGGIVVTNVKTEYVVSEDDLKKLQSDGYIAVTKVQPVEVNDDEPNTETGDEGAGDEGENTGNDGDGSQGNDEGASDEGDESDEGNEDALPSKSVLLRENNLAQLHELAKTRGVEVAQDATKAQIADAVIAAAEK